MDDIFVVKLVILEVCGKVINVMLCRWWVWFNKGLKDYMKYIDYRICKIYVILVKEFLWLIRLGVFDEE